ncbi:MAG: diadenylate cyclase [Methanocellales archaeon]|nr:diadenylate cyclase [Methanocellales archaeon]
MKRDVKTAISNAAVKLAENIGAAAIIIVDDGLKGGIKTNIPVIVASVGKGASEIKDDLAVNLLSRASIGISQLRRAVMDAYLKGGIRASDVVVGVIGGERADTIMVYDVSEAPIIRSIDEGIRINPRVIRNVLRLALELGYEGRESRKIGTAFIIGDSDEVLKRSHQMVLNPYEGHKKKNRDVANPDNWESIKNFAQLDGVFVVGEDGYIIAAGRYLDIDASGIKVKKGLGGRHAASAAISRDTQAIAITVSQSGGVVRIYKDGLQVAEMASGI